MFQLRRPPILHVVALDVFVKINTIPIPLPNESIRVEVLGVPDLNTRLTTRVISLFEEKPRRMRLTHSILQPSCLKTDFIIISTIYPF